MRRLSLWLAVAAMGIGLSPSDVLAQASSACRAADATSTEMLQWLRTVVVGTDPASIAQRTQMGLPQLSASQVSLVTDKTVCSKVLTTYKTRAIVKSASTGAVIPSSGKLYVFKVGTVYTATDPTLSSAGGPHIWVSVDGRYAILGSSLG
jgi:hypothetical protein